MLTPGAGAAVELRGAGADVIEASVIAVTAGGVTIDEDGAHRAIGWDRVKRITGPMAEAAAPFADLSDDAWRARIRLSRGDIALATPLFEGLFAQLKGGGGPTAVMAADGLLQCRLRQGAVGAAVDPWLEVVRLRREGGHVAAATGGAIDDGLLVAPGLPPVWLDVPSSLGALQAAPAPTEDPIVIALGAWMRAAASLSSGSFDAPETSTETAQHPGVALLMNMTLAQSPDGAARRRAREWLEEGLQRDIGLWREAWRRTAIGRSLLMEQDESARLRGMVHLAHLPARFFEAHPYLTGVALALSIDELERRGDADGAARLRRDLSRLGTDHPGARWLERRDLERHVSANGRSAPDLTPGSDR